MTTGSKVICINGNFHPAVAVHYTALPVEGQTYTVRDMMPGISPNGDPEIAVTLVELVNPKSSRPPHPERAFNIERFRDLETTVEELVRAEHEKGREVRIDLKPKAVPA